ncbi:MAG: hypothetical protein PV344_01995, partial [Anaplasma sp.]|nr:hypothetical protein [Anaplasma sp.]
DGKLKSELSNVREEEILAFAKGLATQRPDINKKICYKARIGGEAAYGSEVKAACQDSDRGRDMGGLYAFLKGAIREFSIWTLEGTGGRVANVVDMVNHIRGRLTPEEKE